MNIKLKADNYHKKQYKKLLCSEWRHDTVKDLFLLTDNFLNSGGLPVSYSKRPDAAEWEKNMLPYISLISDQIGAEYFPAVPKKIPERKSVTKIYRHRLVSEAVYNLTFPLSLKSGEFRNQTIKLNGDTDFLKDLKSLTVLLALNCIIPELAKERMKEEHDYIICILFLNTLITWHDNPAHQNYLLSVLFDKIGRSDMYRAFLYNSFRLTSPEDHDYLTKAQAYWSALIDEKMFDEAEDFVLKLLKNSGEEHFEEIKEIISLTFHLQHA
ncbi:MAG: hypothetical protein GY749_16535 [Desulfobacteraceae bacterium]|nr:hypothetical protein [Desulfobacteraceae bacterium]